jgi:hypothetical protein
LFVCSAAAIAALAAIGLPVDLLPAELWALRPIAVATNVASLLLGAAVFGRRPDTWETNRTLGVAVFVIAAGVLAETVGAVAVGFAWQAALDLPTDVGWTLLAVAYVRGALNVLGIALIWLTLDRSLRSAGVHGSRWVAVLLWSVALLVAAGGLASAVQAFNAIGASMTRISVATGVVIGMASIVAVTALTLTAFAGARAGEQPTAAWWAAVASGLLASVGAWLASMFTAVANPTMVVSILLPEVVGLGSTLLLLSAFALGLPSSRGLEPSPSSDRDV